MDNKLIELFDTTLRDGTQGEGVNLSVEDKIRIAEKLDEFGINIIEGGWPGSNPRDKEFFKQVKSLMLTQADMCSFGSTARKVDNIEKDPNLNELLFSETKIITIFGKTWEMHSKHGLGINRAENALLIEKSVSYLVNRGRRVIFDAEHFFDGFKDDKKFALDMLQAAINGGADTLVLCDTNGGSLPDDIKKATSNVCKNFTQRIGIHCHNDSGLAVANTITAVLAGVTHVQGTINGVGERCGNVSLASVIPNLLLKLGLETQTNVKLENLSNLVQFIYDIMNMHPDDQAPFIGKSAFAHKGGIHVSAVMKDSRMYEHISPSLVGNTQRVLISDLSGKSNIRFKANELNMSLLKENNLSSEAVDRIKNLEYQGYQFESAEASLELIFKEISGEFKPYFQVLDSRVQVDYDRDGHKRADAVLKVIVQDEIEHTASDGNGPVDALNKALRKALLRFFPELEEVKLTDYKVRVINEQDGTSAKVRVLIESSDGKSTWSTVGVSQNIIDASWQALSDSFNYKLARTRDSEKPNGSSNKVKHSNMV